MKGRYVHVLATLVSTIVATVLAGSASAAKQQRVELATPDKVAEVTFPSLNEYWSKVFANSGLKYRAPRAYWWYNRPGNRRWIPIARLCDDFQKKGDGRIWGGRDREYTPNSFYCPVNEQVYLDWTFLRTLGSRDDARVALVLAHEFGHHVQRLLGWPVQKRMKGQFANYELHADCYAGVWFAYAEEQGILERGDLLNAGIMLGYLGDPDNTPWTEAGAHGSHSDRQEWFTYGYERADPSACDKVFD